MNNNQKAIELMRSFATTVIERMGDAVITHKVNNETNAEFFYVPLTINGKGTDVVLQGTVYPVDPCEHPKTDVDGNLSQRVTIILTVSPGWFTYRANVSQPDLDEAKFDLFVKAHALAKELTSQVPEHLREFDSIVKRVA